MANNFELKFDKLIIKNLTQDLQKNFQEFSKKELTDALAVYDKNLDSGKNVDGGSLKGYSASYREMIRKKQLKSRKGRVKNKAATPTNLLLTGDLRKGRKVQKAQGEKIGAEIVFGSSHYSGGSGAQLAKKLHARGFLGWHQYSKKDLVEIPKKALVLFDEIVKKGITIVKKT